MLEVNDDKGVGEVSLLRRPTRLERRRRRRRLERRAILEAESPKSEADEAIAGIAGNGGH